MLFLYENDVLRNPRIVPCVVISKSSPSETSNTPKRTFSTTYPVSVMPKRACSSF